MSVEVTKSLMREKCKEGKQTLADLSSAHCCSQAECQTWYFELDNYYQLYKEKLE